LSPFSAKKIFIIIVIFVHPVKDKLTKKVYKNLLFYVVQNQFKSYKQKVEYLWMLKKPKTATNFTTISCIAISTLSIDQCSPQCSLHRQKQHVRLAIKLSLLFLFVGSCHKIYRTSISTCFFCRSALFALKVRRNALRMICPLREERERERQCVRARLGNGASFMGPA
jgi:hypothetical protein